jgi:spermidine synthase
MPQPKNAAGQNAHPAAQKLPPHCHNLKGFAMPATIKERLYKGYAQVMEVAGKPLAAEKTRYQRVEIFDTVANGRVMTLDGIVQITTRDESAYAEMLTHLPMLEHGRVERVMIVGGGDLSIADEALKHRGVKEVVLVDIDGRVVELCKKHFTAINAKAQRDRRLKIEIADAFEYLGRRENRARFDLIVADRPDPVGPGKALFGETFYDRVKGALKPGGFATFQTGVPFYQPEELSEALREIGSYFPQSGVYLTVVPTYIGGFMALSWVCKGRGKLGAADGVRKARARFARAGLRTDYYNPQIHQAAFALPEWIARLVPKAKKKKARRRG